MYLSRKPDKRPKTKKALSLSLSLSLAWKELKKQGLATPAKKRSKLPLVRAIAKRFLEQTCSSTTLKKNASKSYSLSLSLSSCGCAFLRNSFFILFLSFWCFIFRFLIFRFWINWVLIFVCRFSTVCLGFSDLRIWLFSLWFFISTFQFSKFWFRFYVYTISA